MAPNRVTLPPSSARSNIQTRHTLERLSQVGSDGATPAVLGINAILLERMVSRRLADRLPPLAPGASYSYRISEKGTTRLIPRE